MIFSKELGQIANILFQMSKLDAIDFEIELIKENNEGGSKLHKLLEIKTNRDFFYTRCKNAFLKIFDMEELAVGMDFEFQSSEDFINIIKKGVPLEKGNSVKKINEAINVFVMEMLYMISGEYESFISK